MKKTEKKKPVKSMPQGVWEASRSEHTEKEKNKELSDTTDLQGNGYPKNSSKN